MSNLALCRMCLSDSVKIHSILNSPLQDIYEKLASCKLSTEDGRPETVCYICLSQLQRFYKFRDKSRKSGDILSKLFHDGIEISTQTVSVLNKEIQHNFCTTPVKSITYSSASNQVLVKEEPESIKEEIEITLEENVEIKVKSESAMCRVCLSGDLRTQTIKNSPLQEIYEKITNTKLVSEDGRPEELCFICVVQLHRWRRLIPTANKSENILTEILYNGAQLTIPSVVNRRAKSQYSIATLDAVSYCAELEVNHCAELEVNQEIVRVKEEFIEIELPMRDDTEDFPVLGENQMKTEPDQEIPTIHGGQTFKSEFEQTDEIFECCDVCNYKCDSGIKLKKHLSMHDPNRRYSCELCSYRFESSNHLTNHMEKVHRTKHECGNCDQVFPTLNLLKSHSQIHTAKYIYSCEKCNRIFDKEMNLRTHYYNVHPGEKYFCDRCEFTTKSDQSLQDHILRTHADSPYFVCDVCHKTLSLKSSLKRHLLNHVSKKAYECKICFKTFSTSQNCRVHNMLHTGEKPYTCDICEKGFREKQRWKLHALTHFNGKKPFSCNVCEKEFYRKDVFKKHMTIHTAQKIYACNLCDLKFTSSTYVKKHMISHSDERPFACEVCQKRFKASATLKCHMTVHNGEKTFTCDLCTKSFTKKQYLLGHMKYHNRRPFACNACGKHFHTKQILLLHSRTHTGEKPYVCLSCDRRFTQKSSLRRHLRAHSGDTPHSCDICSKQFAEKISLFTHKLSVHAKIDTYICDICYKVSVDRKKIIQHLRSHKSKKPFTCERCQKEFLKLSSLTHHVKTHSGGEFRCAFCEVKFESKTNLDRHNVSSHGAVKQYACNRCEQPFDGLIRLNSHIRTHTGEKQFACELCDKTYVEKRDLQNHMKVIHNKLQCFE